MLVRKVVPLKRLPSEYPQVKELGIVIAHGSEASDWRGRLLAELAVSLARSGAAPGALVEVTRCELWFMCAH